MEQQRKQQRKPKRDVEAVFLASHAALLEIMRKQPQRASTSTPPPAARRLEVMKARTA